MDAPSSPGQTHWLTFRGDAAALAGIAVVNGPEQLVGFLRALLRRSRTAWRGIRFSCRGLTSFAGGRFRLAVGEGLRLSSTLAHALLLAVTLGMALPRVIVRKVQPVALVGS
jgi:hypothetical protein